MTITATLTQSNVVLQRAYGTHLDDAATPALKVVTVGFQPAKVTILNETDRISYEWYSDMANGTALKTVAAGTRTLDTTDVSISVAQTPAQQTPPYTATGYKPVIEKGTFNVTFAAAILLQNKQYTFVIEG